MSTDSKMSREELATGIQSLLEMFFDNNPSGFRGLGDFFSSLGAPNILGHMGVPAELSAELKDLLGAAASGLGAQVGEAKGGHCALCDCDPSGEPGGCKSLSGLFGGLGGHLFGADRIVMGPGSGGLTGLREFLGGRAQKDPGPMPTELFGRDDHQLLDVLKKVGVVVPKIELPATLEEDNGEAMMPEKYNYEMQLFLAAGPLFVEARRAYDELVTAHNAFNRIYPGSYAEEGLGAMPREYFTAFMGEALSMRDLLERVLDNDEFKLEGKDTRADLVLEISGILEATEEFPELWLAKIVAKARRSFKTECVERIVGRGVVDPLRKENDERKDMIALLQEAIEHLHDVGKRLAHHIPDEILETREAPKVRAKMSMMPAAMRCASVIDKHRLTSEMIDSLVVDSRALERVAFYLDLPDGTDSVAIVSAVENEICQLRAIKVMVCGSSEATEGELLDGMRDLEGEVQSRDLEIDAIRTALGLPEGATITEIIAAAETGGDLIRWLEEDSNSKSVANGEPAAEVVEEPEAQAKGEVVGDAVEKPDAGVVEGGSVAEKSEDADAEAEAEGDRSDAGDEEGSAAGS